MKIFVTPGDSVYGDSCLINLLKHKAYIEFCCNSDAIQRYWCHPEYVVHRMNDAMQEFIPIVTSHINPGDYFNLGGSGYAQIGIVTRKITVVQSGLEPEHWKPSPEKPGGAYLKYCIEGNIGGVSPYGQPHKELASGFFCWIPLPCQLIAANLMDEAHALQSILVGIARAKTNWKTTWAKHQNQDAELQGAN
jgi:hypothetical protein